MSLTCHFVDKHWKPCSVLIGFSEFSDIHSGKNIFEQMFSLLDSFFNHQPYSASKEKGKAAERMAIDSGSVDSSDASSDSEFKQSREESNQTLMMKAENYSRKILAITTDNASNNVSFVEEAVEKKLLESPECHIQCFAHVLNLAAKAALEVMEDSITSIHLVVAHIRKSSHENRLFKKKCKENKISYTTPKLNNETRWNSTYYMLSWALKYKVPLTDVLYENGKTKRWKEAVCLNVFLVITLFTFLTVSKA